MEVCQVHFSVMVLLLSMYVVTGLLFTYMSYLLSKHVQ